MSRSDEVVITITRIPGPGGRIIFRGRARVGDGKAYTCEQVFEQIPGSPTCRAVAESAKRRVWFELAAKVNEVLA